MLNNLLDNLNHLHITIFNHTYPAYKVCGYTGYVLAFILAMLLTLYLDLSFWITFLLFCTTVSTFFTLAMITKIIIGEERLIYYHHEIAILLTATLVLWLLNRPILVYLDIVVLGIGTFLTCGRIGCLMVGCCHGKPHTWGVCYGRKHVEKGFTRCFQGIRLFPVQALEALWVLEVTVIVTILLFLRYPAGEALTWFIMAYGAGRFCFEFLRGDMDRPYWYGFSEAQWTTIMLMLLVLGMEGLGKTNFHIWHFSVCIVCLLVMIILTGLRKWLPSKLHPFLFPQDLKDFADKLNKLAMWHILHSQPGSQVAVMETQQGIQISADRIVNGKENIFFYSISQKNNPLILKTANRLGKYIQQLKHPNLPFRVLPGRNNVFHILFQGIIFKSKKKAKAHCSSGW